MKEEPVQKSVQENVQKKRTAWLKLALGLAGIWLFVFFLAPWLSGFEPAKSILDFVHENDIDATALFYTEIDEFSEAEIAVRDALRR